MKQTFWIFSTGTELTRGYSRDTNSSEIAQLLVNNGFDINGISLIPDNKQLLKKNFIEKIQDPYISGLIITGGLGPTDDDHTIDVLAEITQKEIIEDHNSLEKLKNLAEKTKRIDIQIARRQIRVLKDSLIIFNTNGIAPGMILEYNHKVIVALPGVPMEMRSMINHVIDYLNKKFIKEYYEKYSFFIYNEPESEFQKNYKNIEKKLHTNFLWGVSANPGFLKVFIENTEPEKKEIFYKFKYSIEEYYNDRFLEKPIENKIQELMISNKKTLSCAESCTGGLLGKILTDIPGSSEYFLGSIVAYSNELKKILLGVNPDTLEKYGAVSEECAKEMVLGLFNKIKTDYSISITGIAGPGGGTIEKPVGTVYIGIKSPFEVKIHKIYYPGTRDRIREYTVYTALYFLYKELKKDFTNYYK